MYSKLYEQSLRPNGMAVVMATAAFTPDVHYEKGSRYRTITFGADQPTPSKSGWAPSFTNILRALVALATVAVFVLITINLSNTDSKIDKLVETLNSPASPSPPPLSTDGVGGSSLSSPPPTPTPTPAGSSNLVYPTTLSRACGLTVSDEISTLYVYPPSGGALSNYLEDDDGPVWERIVRLDSDGQTVDTATQLHPKDSNGTWFPPYFGACNAAKNSWATAKSVCIQATDRQMPNSTVFCGLVERYAFIFSLVLQFEYLATISFTGDGTGYEFGSAYVSSVFDDRLELGGNLGQSVNPSNRPLVELFDNTVQEMLSIINNRYCCPACSPTLGDAGCGLANLFVGVIGPAGFRGHSKGALTNVRSTVEDINSALETLQIEDYQNANSNPRATAVNGKYPAYFDLCLASRRMFDYMLQNPYKRYKNKLSGSLNRMFRCSEPGANILQAMSTILEWEYASKNDQSKCPNASAIATILDEASLLISRSSEFHYGKLSSIIAKEGGDVFTSPPTVTATFWLPGNDVYQLQWYWIEFIMVHVDQLQRYCDQLNQERVRFKNPFGFGYKQTYTISDSYFLAQYAEMQEWSAPEESDAIKFDEAPTYAPYDPTVMNSELWDYDRVVEMTPFNNEYVSVRENAEMNTKYSLERRFRNSDALYTGIQPRFDDVYKSCEYDPTGYVEQFFYLQAPLNRGLVLGFFDTMADLPISYTNLTLDGVSKCTPDEIECLKKFCSLKLGDTLNPANKYIPYGGDYATAKTFTVGYFAAPFCLDAGHAETMNRCSDSA